MKQTFSQIAHRCYRFRLSIIYFVLSSSNCAKKKHVNFNKVAAVATLKNLHFSSILNANIALIHSEAELKFPSTCLQRNFDSAMNYEFDGLP